LAFVGLSLYSVYLFRKLIYKFTVPITYLLLLAMVTLDSASPVPSAHDENFQQKKRNAEVWVVYLNRGNDLYVAIDMSRMLTNFIGP